MSQKQRKISLNKDSLNDKKVDLSTSIMGVTINGTHIEGVLKKVFVQRKGLLHIATVNPEFVMEARANDRFRNILAQTEIKVADGWGIVWALWLVKSERVRRITGVQLVEEILKRANTRGEKVFLLGSRPGVAEKAAEMIKNKYQELEIAWYEGARTVKVEKSEEASMTIARINAFEPDYLLVAYGSPWQDIWIEENRPYLRARVAIGVGGVLDEWAGVVRPTPKWVDEYGLRWLYRLLVQPWRWRRVMRVMGFGWLVMGSYFRDLFRGRHHLPWLSN